MCISPPTCDHCRHLAHLSAEELVERERARIEGLYERQAKWAEGPPEVASQVAALVGRPDVNLLLAAIDQAIVDYFQAHQIDNATSLNLTARYGRRIMHKLVLKNLVIATEAASVEALPPIRKQLVLLRPTASRSL